MDSSVPSIVMVSVSVPTVNFNFWLPKSSTTICSPVTLLFCLLSFHFPQKGSSFAQSAPARSAASASAHVSRFMGTSREAKDYMRNTLVLASGARQVVRWLSTLIRNHADVFGSIPSREQSGSVTLSAPRQDF